LRGQGSQVALLPGTKVVKIGKIGPALLVEDTARGVPEDFWCSLAGLAETNCASRDGSAYQREEAHVELKMQSAPSRKVVTVVP